MRARVAELVELVGLDPELLGRYPAALSGGQQQRVGVARALAADPPVLLMDEPYSAVDPIVRARLQDELLDLQRRRAQDDRARHPRHRRGDQARRPRRHPRTSAACSQQYAPPAELLRAPANEFVEQFLGRERALRRMALLTVADAAPAARAGRVGVGHGRRGARRSWPSTASTGSACSTASGCWGGCRERRPRRASHRRRAPMPSRFVAWVRADDAVAGGARHHRRQPHPGRRRPRRRAPTPAWSPSTTSPRRWPGDRRECSRQRRPGRVLRLGVGRRPPRRHPGRHATSTCGSR